jgi:hypothetical protein
MNIMKELSGNMYFKALEFATKAHEGQMRKGGKMPFAPEETTKPQK